MSNEFDGIGLDDRPQREMAAFNFRIVPPTLEQIRGSSSYRRPEGRYDEGRYDESRYDESRYDEGRYDEGSWPEPEALVWRSIGQWEAAVQEDIQRLLGFRYGEDLTTVVESYEVASITGSIVLLLAAGLSVANFLSKYKDFYESLNLLDEHLNIILSRATHEVIQERYPGYVGAPQVSVDLESAIKPPPSVKSPASPKPPPGDKPVYKFQLLTGKNIFRVLAVLIVGLVLLSQVQVFRSAVGVFWDVPELRYRLVYLTGTQGDVENQGVLVVSNEGYGPAQDLFLQFMLAENTIRSYQVVAQEPYEIRSVDPGGGEVSIWLDRLAAGAVVALHFETTQPLMVSNIRFSAVSDQGVAVSLHPLLVQSDPGDYEPSLSNPIQEFVYTLSDTATGRVLYERYLSTPAGKTIRNPVFLMVLSLVSVGFLVAWIAWYFEAALAVGALGIWLVAWWFFDTEVGAYWVFMLFFGVVVMLITGMENERRFEIMEWLDRRPGPASEWVLLSAGVVLAVFWLLAMWWFWNDQIPLTSLVFLTASILIWHARRVRLT